MSETSKKSSSRSKGSSRPAGGRADHVIVRNLFALSILRRQTLIAIISIIAAILSVFSAYQVIKVKTPPQYVQLTEDGRIYPIPPLNMESVSDGEIINFASDSVKWLNTYDFVSWKDQLQVQSSRFTPSGWDSFVQSLVETDNLETVKTQSLVVSARPTKNPYIKQKGIASGQNTFVWHVRVPVSISYSRPKGDTSQAEIPDQEGTVSLYISRVPLEVNLKGYAIQIYQFELGPDKERP